MKLFIIVFFTAERKFNIIWYSSSKTKKKKKEREREKEKEKEKRERKITPILYILISF